ncbi:hypothetical protein I317_04021 [Kwoniella heveanensis CBS 569]|nr:hypothetical protein I317_04021 [Kwoniella heveanensis CBS 569]
MLDMVNTSNGNGQRDEPIGAVILLNGYPATGKSSVAKELVKILPNARILEYHALRQVVDSLADRGREERRWNQLKKALLQTILQTLSTPPPTTSPVTSTFSSPASTSSSLSNPSISNSPPIYILTAHLCATPSRLSLLHAHLSEALPLIHILLSCSTEENIRRLESPRRDPRKSGMDEHLLRELRMEEDLGRFLNPSGAPSGSGATSANIPSWITHNNESSSKDVAESGGRSNPGSRRGSVIGLIGEYEVNTERLSVRDTAGIVGEYALEILRREGWWFHFTHTHRRMSKE